MAGPLSGLTIVEMAGIGPAPFAGMMLADHGATVIRVERDGLIGFDGDPLRRSRTSIALDLAQPEARDVVRRLAQRADGLIEGYRPGVMERLGLGPDELRCTNRSLVYGRVTGWGQDGPLRDHAGHDIDYLALSGLLHAIGPAERPVPPANLIADFAAGGMMLAFGMVAALLAVERDGEGQVVDVAMSEGAALIGAMLFGMRAAGMWSLERESNLLDGGSPAYGVYRCTDGRFLALGAIESRFKAALFDALDLPIDSDRKTVADRIATRPRDEWVEVCGPDCCVAPVLDMDEAPLHPQHLARDSFLALDDVTQPAPAPRFSATPADVPSPPGVAGRDGETLLTSLGYAVDDIARLRASGALR